MKEFSELTIKLTDHVALIEINRPPNNFFDYILIGQIADALTD